MMNKPVDPPQRKDLRKTQANINVIKLKAKCSEYIKGLSCLYLQKIHDIIVKKIIIVLAKKTHPSRKRKNVIAINGMILH